MATRSMGGDDKNGAGGKSKATATTATASTAAASSVAGGGGNSNSQGGRKNNKNANNNNNDDVGGDDNDFGGDAGDSEYRDPFVDADQQFKLMQARFQKQPISGLASQQRDRHRHVKMRVNEIRNMQQRIFHEHFKQFPDLAELTATNSGQYSTIWESFRTKDDELTSLNDKVGELTSLMSDLNSK
jgi:hypothetical protein